MRLSSHLSRAPVKTTLSTALGLLLMASVSSHSVSATGRYTRLNILAAQQDGGGAAKIYELEVYA